jgi:DNA-binding GntR family transcriptional regulator
MTRELNISDRIREDILGGALPFGGKLTIASLAERYGVSQMPIRMALSELQGEGLLKVSDTGRTTIRAIDRHFVSNIFDIRGALETLLIKSAARLITERELDELEMVERELERHVDAADYAAAQQANRQFHKVIARAAHNADAEELLDRHFFLVAALWRRVAYGPERFSGVVNDHRFIVRALRAHDADAAVALTAGHVTKARLTLLERFDQTFPSAGQNASDGARRRTRRRAVESPRHGSLLSDAG